MNRDASEANSNDPNPDDHDDVLKLEQLKQAFQRITSQMKKVIVGQEEVVEQLLIALFAGGHCVLVGVPGLAKTLMIRTLAQTLELNFNRIQFTPDLMPSDITGTELIDQNKETGEKSFRFVPGPIFSQVLLADEINRTPPKTQAALLEAMQEHQVTVNGKRYSLDEPFFVLATQNPLDHEGTYPLPEAQLDRFMFQVLVDYPTELEELDIVMRTTSETRVELESQLKAEQISELKSLVRRIPVAEHLALYALRLARATRPESETTQDWVRDYLSWGAGPRASQNLVLAAKARAALYGNPVVTSDDIRAVAAPILRHRIRLNFSAEADGVSTDEVIERLLDQIPMTDESENRGFIANLLRPKTSGPN